MPALGFAFVTFAALGARALRALFDAAPASGVEVP